MAYSLIATDVTAAMLVEKNNSEKVFWDFDSVIMQNLNHFFLLFCHQHSRLITSVQSKNRFLLIKVKIKPVTDLSCQKPLRRLNDYFPHYKKSVAIRTGPVHRLIFAIHTGVFVE